MDYSNVGSAYRPQSTWAPEPQRHPIEIESEVHWLAPSQAIPPLRFPKAYHEKPHSPSRWKRSVLALTLAFVGGTLARPSLERETRPRVEKLVRDVRLVWPYLVDSFPAWTHSILSANDDPTVATHFTVPRPEIHELDQASETPPLESPVAMPADPVSTIPVSTDPVEAEPSHEPTLKRVRHVRPSPTMQVAVNPAPQEAPQEPPPAPDSIDALMTRALDDPASDTQAKATRRNGDASELTHDQISETMRRLPTSACGAGLGKTTHIPLLVTVDRDGSVTAVHATGSSFASREARCLEHTVKQARFPELRGLKFRYRFAISPSTQGVSMAMVSSLPERVSLPIPQAPVATERKSNEIYIPRVANKMRISNDPLAGVNGRTIEGKPSVRRKTSRP